MQEDINNEYDEAQTIGEILRNARNKQGKNLRNIADELCIRRVYLEAIENMDIKNIPEAPYGIGFIRSYAEYLGLNGERIITSYKQTVYGLKNEPTTPQEQKTTSSAPKFRHILWGIIGLAIVAFVWSQRPLFNTEEADVEFENTIETTPVSEPVIIEETDSQTLPEEAKEISPLQNDEETSATTENPKTEDKSKEITENKTEEDNKINTPQVVKMVLTGPSWVEVKVNGKTVLSRTLRKGFEYKIDDVANTTVTVGRHNNVKFFADGKEIKVVTAIRRKNVALINFIKKDSEAE